MARPNEDTSNASFYTIEAAFPVDTVRGVGADQRVPRSLLCFTDGAISVRRPDGVQVDIPANAKGNVRYPIQFDRIVAAPGPCLVLY